MANYVGLKNDRLRRAGGRTQRQDRAGKGGARGLIKSSVKYNLAMEQQEQQRSRQRRRQHERSTCIITIMDA